MHIDIAEEYIFLHKWFVNDLDTTHCFEFQVSFKLKSKTHIFNFCYASIKYPFLLQRKQEQDMAKFPGHDPIITLNTWFLATPSQ